MTAPPTTSLCPFRYLVVECITRSAPSDSGCCHIGERKVLSTTTKAPTACAASAIARISTTRSKGLLGVSIHTRLRPRLEGRAQRGGIALIDEIDNEIALRMQRGQQPIGAAVAIVGRNDARAMRQGRQDQGDGRQPRAGHHRAGAALQIRQGAWPIDRESDCRSGCSRTCAACRTFRTRNSSTDKSAAPPSRAAHPTRARREPNASRWLSFWGGVAAHVRLLREG